MIHQTSIIHETAFISEDASIGPYCVIGPNVKIMNNVILKSHVCIEGYTTIDEGTVIFPFASIGLQPQDLKYVGEESTLYIGKRNVIREYVTIHPGTIHGGMTTRVGDDCLLMIGAHVAHDCILGNNVIMANNATIGGHVVVGDFAILGGLSAVHQFVRIGAHCIIGGGSIVVEDVIPFGSVSGERAELAGLNIIGMKRRNFDKNSIKALQQAFKMIFSVTDQPFEKRVAAAYAIFENDANVMEMISFLQADTSRSICMPKEIAGH